MHRFAVSLLLLASFAAIANGQTPTLPKIEPKLLREDLRIARMSLEEGHSGLYRYTPKPELDRAFDSAAEKLDHPMNALEFLRILAPVVAEIKCGHTSVRPPIVIRDALAQTIPLFPFDVVVLNDHVYVTREYLPSEQHLSGLQIRRINGIAIDSILRTMLADAPGDADSRTVRPTRVSDTFPSMLYNLLGIESPFQLEFKDSNRSTPTTIRPTFRMDAQAALVLWSGSIRWAPSVPLRRRWTSMSGWMAAQARERIRLSAPDIKILIRSS
jgi:hypothetical protein